MNTLTLLLPGILVAPLPVFTELEATVKVSVQVLLLTAETGLNHG
jgi:hypothetical protein